MGVIARAARSAKPPWKSPEKVRSALVRMVSTLEEVSHQRCRDGLYRIRVQVVAEVTSSSFTRNRHRPRHASFGAEGRHYALASGFGRWRRLKDFPSTHHPKTNQAPILDW